MLVSCEIIFNTMGRKAQRYKKRFDRRKPIITDNDNHFQVEFLLSITNNYRNHERGKS